MGLWVMALIVVGLLGLVLLAAGPGLMRRHAARRLHGRLAKTNGLDAAETAWLWQLARRRSPALPAAVFVRPSLLDPSLFEGDDGAEHRLRSVRRKLFDLR